MLGRAGAGVEGRDDVLLCALAGFGCTVTCPRSQLQRWVEHANTHSRDFDDDGALWAGLVFAACEEKKLAAEPCVCGLFYPSTQHGRRTHRAVCAAASGQDAADSALGGAHASAYSGAFAGITTQGFGADVRESEVAIGALLLRAVERGATAGAHSLACFYLSCRSGDPVEAIALKDLIADAASALARARKPGCGKSFAGLSMMAEEEVFLAFALLVGPLCVVHTAARAGPQGVLYLAPGKTDGPVTFVLYRPGHFQELDGRPTSVEQLRSAATQMGPPLPPRRAAARRSRSPPCSGQARPPQARRLRPSPATAA